jgi:hypothetical protein
VLYRYHGVTGVQKDSQVIAEGTKPGTEKQNGKVQLLMQLR